MMSAIAPRHAERSARHGLEQSPARDAVLDLVDRGRGKWVRAHVMWGLGLALGMMGAVLLLASVIDVFVHLSEAGRWMGWLAMVALTGSILTLWVGRPACCGISRTNLARQWESDHPDAQSRLISVIDLSQSVTKPASLAFWTALLDETHQWLQPKKASFEKVPRVGDSTRMSLWCLAPAVALALGLLAVPDMFGPATSRVLMPWKDIAPPGAPRLQLPGDVMGERDQPLDLTFTLVDGSVGESRIEFRAMPGSSDLTSATSFAVPLAFGDTNTTVYTVPALTHPLQYRVWVDGLTSRWCDITLARRPVLLQTELTINPPAYLSDLPAQPVAEDVTELKILQGSSIDIASLVQGDADAGQVVWQKPRALNKLPIDPASVVTWLDIKAEPAMARWGQARIDKKEADKPIIRLGKPSGWEENFFEPKPAQPVSARSVLQWNVWLDPEAMPRVIALELETKTKHTFFWYRDNARGAVDQNWFKDTKNFTAVGPLPDEAGWSTLSVPLQQWSDMTNMLFKMKVRVENGRLGWHTVQLAQRRQRTASDWIDGQIHAMTGKQIQADDRQELIANDSTQQVDSIWKTKIQPTNNGWFVLRFSNQRGQKSEPSKRYKVTLLQDLPPTLDWHQPGKSASVSKPVVFPVSAKVNDDVALDRLVMLVRDGKTGAVTETEMSRWTQAVTASEVTTPIDLAELGLAKDKPIVIRLRLTDRKGNIVESEPRTINLHDHHDALDRQMERFQKEQEEALEKVKELAKKQKEIAQETEKAKKKVEELQENSTTSEQQKNEQKKELAKEYRELEKKQDQVRHEMHQAKDKINRLAEKAQREAAIDATQAEQLKQAAQEAKDLADKTLPEAKEQIKESRADADDAPKAQQADAAAQKAKAELDRLAKKMELLKKRTDEMAKKADEKSDVEKKLAQLEKAAQADAQLQKWLERLQAQREQVQKEMDKQDKVAAKKADNDRAKEEKAKEQTKANDEAKNTLKDVEQTVKESEQADAKPQDAKGDADPEKGEMKGEDGEADKGKPEAGEGEEGKPEAGEGDKGEPEAGEGEKGEPMNKPGEKPKGSDKSKIAGEQPKGENAPLFPSLAKGKPTDKAPGEKGEPQEGKPGDPQPAGEGEGEMQDPEKALAQETKQVNQDLDKADDILAKMQQSAQQSLEQLRDAPAEMVEQVMQSQSLAQELARAEQSAPMVKSTNTASVDPGSKASTGDNMTAREKALHLDRQLAELPLTDREREELLRGLREQSPAGYERIVQQYFRHLAETQPKK